jgi:hypothetical protein
MWLMQSSGPGIPHLRTRNGVCCVAKHGEKDWPIINQMMKSAFEWGTTETGSAVKEMLNRGEFGLDGFIHFIKFFVVERGRALCLRRKLKRFSMNLSW